MKYFMINPPVHFGFIPILNKICLDSYIYTLGYGVTYALSGWQGQMFSPRRLFYKSRSGVTTIWFLLFY